MAKLKQKKFKYLLYIWDKKISDLYDRLRRSKSKKDSILAYKILTLTKETKEAMFQLHYNEVQRKFRLSYHKWKQCFKGISNDIAIFPKKNRERRKQNVLNQIEILELQDSPQSRDKLLKNNLIKPVIQYFPNRKDLITIISNFVNTENKKELI